MPLLHFRVPRFSADSTLRDLPFAFPLFFRSPIRQGFCISVNPQQMYRLPFPLSCQRGQRRSRASLRSPLSSRHPTTRSERTKKKQHNSQIHETEIPKFTHLIQSPMTYLLTLGADISFTTAFRHFQFCNAFHDAVGNNLILLFCTNGLVGE